MTTTFLPGFEGGATRSDGLELAELLRPLLRNPYDFYDALRPATPLRLDEVGTCVVASYDDVKAVLSDSAYEVVHPRDPQVDLLALDPDSPAVEAVRNERFYHFQFMEPTHHAAVRRIVQKALAVESLESRRSTVRHMTSCVIDRLAEHDTIDAVQDMALPVPTLAAARALSIPSADWPLVLKWPDPLARWLEMFVSPDELHESAVAIKAARKYLGETFDRLGTGEHENELMAALVRCERDGLTRDVAVAVCIHILVGNVTTASVIANTLVALACHPDQWDMIRVDPALAASAVEETIRWDPPIQAALRRASQKRILGQTEVQPGELVVVLLAAANRDPRQFNNPTTFDIRRTRTRHLGLGLGAHHCSGAQVGRVTATSVIEAVAERVVSLEVDMERLVWSDNLAQRKLDSAPMLIHKEA